MEKTSSYAREGRQGREGSLRTVKLDKFSTDAILSKVVPLASSKVNSHTHCLENGVKKKKNSRILTVKCV